MGDEQLPADDVTRSVHNKAASVDGPVVQVGSVDGDVTVNVSKDPPQGHEVPFIATFFYRPSRRIRRVKEEASDASRPIGGRLTVLVEGRSAQAVVLKALRPVVLARRVLGLTDDEELLVAGIMKPRQFTLDLTADPPNLTAEELDFPFTVTASDPEEFRMDLRDGWQQQQVDWYLELDWICAGRAGTHRIAPDTGHFTHDLG